ncbi:hypothetical protein AX23_10710 [Brucella melitensis 548]|nr:hypothetical protein AX23_10710 [Brucella melitensis 548]
MRTETGHTFRLEDYRQTPYAIPETKLDFTLEPEKTIVRATLTIERRSDTPAGTPLVLHGDELKLVSLAIDGKRFPTTAFRPRPTS